jgi:hypothetical protein
MPGGKSADGIQQWNPETLHSICRPHDALVSFWVAFIKQLKLKRLVPGG